MNLATAMYAWYLVTITTMQLLVVGIKIRNWSAVFFEDMTFCWLLIAVPLKSAVNLANQIAKLVKQWPMANCFL